MLIKVSTSMIWPFERQILKAWSAEGYRVSVNSPEEECDAWVIYQRIRRPVTAVVPSNRIFFYAYEPPGIQDYNKQFLKQFSAVVSCQNLEHPNVVRRHQSQPWFAGVRRRVDDNNHSAYECNIDADGFAALPIPTKERTVSVVCSTKTMVPGHHDRLRFINLLQQYCGSSIDVFGYGFKPIADKLDALTPYRYHLVLENSCIDDYWTEKLADAYLGWCLPIVMGCRNLEKYFPPESYLSLDPTDHVESARRVLAAIASPPTQVQIDAIGEARRRVIEEYNLFAEARGLACSVQPASSIRRTIRDQSLFTRWGSVRPLVRTLTDRWRLS